MKAVSNIWFGHKKMSEVGSVPSNYPYILTHILSRYDFKHVFEAVAADNPAGVGV